MLTYINPKPVEALPPTSQLTSQWGSMIWAGLLYLPQTYGHCSDVLRWASSCHFSPTLWGSLRLGVCPSKLWWSSCHSASVWWHPFLSASKFSWIWDGPRMCLLLHQRFHQSCICMMPPCLKMAGSDQITRSMLHLPPLLLANIDLETKAVAIGRITDHPDL